MLPLKLAASFLHSPVLRWLHEPHFLSRDEGIGRIDDDVLIPGKAGNDLDFGPVVPAEGNPLQFRMLSVADVGDPQTFGSEEQRVDGNDVGIHRGRQLQVNFRIRSAEKSTGRVVNADLDQQSAGTLIDSVCRADKSSGEAFAGKLGEDQIGG